MGTGEVEVEVEVEVKEGAVAEHWACSECFLEMERVGEIMGESEWVKAKVRSNGAGAVIGWLG